jgi:cyclopropane-fatty-acyl-phospholipid synthase
VNPIEWCERGFVPDVLARLGMRALNVQRLLEEGALSPARALARRDAFLLARGRGAIARHTDAANSQHYEVPAAFFEAVLGPRLKYSSCLFPSPETPLARAEEAMLELTCTRAGLADGMRVLDLGCGWGSLSLWVAERFPRCEVVAVSNSAPQRALIEARARALGTRRLTVLTADINAFVPPGHFDRVISIEMFEHMSNYVLLLERIAGWLRPQGRLFVHYFCHRRAAYEFDVEGATNWMAQQFFTGGIMPSFDLLRAFDQHLVVERDWWVAGTHYARTLEAWLERLDADRGHVDRLLAAAYGRDPALWRQRWRMFFMACAELFGMRGGREWGVGHFLLRPRG